MAEVTRQFAPVAAPPSPKPPQLNIVASSLIPDVTTDTVGPGEDVLASAGWESRLIGVERKVRGFCKPAGDTTYMEWAHKRNAIVAAIDSMSDVQAHQVEMPPGTNPADMPVSIFPSTDDSSSRWTGGFAYAPENQYKAVLADPCGQTIDLPALPPPVVTATATSGGGTLAIGTYDYVVTALNANGETVGSAVATATLAAIGHVTLTWVQRGAGRVSAWHVYRKVGTVYDRIATVTTSACRDNGTETPTAAAHPPTTNTTGGPGNYGNLPVVKYVPFLIQVEDECSTFGFTQRDYVGRALRLLDNATPNAIEREFWTGAFARNTFTGPFVGSNAFLTQKGVAATGGTTIAAVDLTPATPPSITRGLQILEDYLANSGFGGQGMLHVAPETSPNLLGARRLGALLLSVMDNIIVPGSGYPTSGATGPIGNTNATPTAGFAWIFASDLTSVRLDEPTITPWTLAEATTRSNFGTPNTIRFRAQRFGAVTFDGARLAACRVKLAT